MAQDPNILKFAQVVERVQAYQAKQASEKEAGATKIPEEDPNRKGEVDISSDPEASKSKQNMPQDNPNTSSEGSKLEDQSTHPHSTGKQRISTIDGTIKEEAACGGDPTKPLSKIAARAQNIMQALNATNGSAPQASGSAQPKSATSVPSAKEANTGVAQDISPDPEFLFKLASTIIETEGGIEAVEPILRKAAGVEAANNLIARATDAYAGLVDEGYEQLELEKQAAEILAYQEQYVGEMLKGASEEDRNSIIKLAQVHDANIETYQDEMLKSAYMQGAMDGAAMEDSMVPEEGGEALPPEEAMIPGAEDGPAGPEEIIALLDAMVQNGELDEETAMAVAEQVMGGGAEMAPEGEEMTPEEEAMVAEASVKQANDLFAKLVEGK